MRVSTFGSRITGFAVAAMGCVHGLLAQPGALDREQSRYWQLSTEAAIAGPTLLRSETLRLTAPAHVFVQSDGYLSPVSTPSSATAMAWVTIDNEPASNASVVSWDRNIDAQPHSYNVIGHASLSAGTHTVRFHATSTGGTATLAAWSNLSVLVAPAARVLEVTLRKDSGPHCPPVEKRGHRRCSWTGVAHSTVARLQIPEPDAPVIALASGSVYTDHVEGVGDAMCAIFLNGRYDAADRRYRASFSVQDLYPDGAELVAPWFCHGVFADPVGRASVPGIDLELVASAFPARSAACSYKVAESAMLLALDGGLQVAGWAGNTAVTNCDSICIGGTGSGCDPLATPRVISRATITIPVGHDGIVMFVGKARCQGNPTDGPSRAWLELMIDGDKVGAIGLQGSGGWLGGHDAAEGQRTLGTSWLAAGENALAPGPHEVRLLATAVSTSHPPRTVRMSIYDDDPFLVWFD